MATKNTISCRTVRLKAALISIAVFMALMGMPTKSHAIDGKIAFGYYFDQEEVRAYPDGGLAKYRSEIEIGHRMGLFKGDVRPFLSLITLMDDYNDGGSFHPASIRYTVGIGWEKKVSKRFFFFTSLEHFCWHPVDSDGTVESADYVEIGFRF